jgi:hypothetical protein
MKKIGILVTVLALSQLVAAMPDISYSNDEGGNWSYKAAETSYEGAFSFVQPIGIDNVQGATSDTLVDAFLFIPSLYISNLTEVFPGSGIYQGSIVPESSVISIKDGDGIDILTGTLAPGGIVTVGTTAALYPTFAFDITVTSITNVIGSDYINNSLSVGDILDFDLTLQGADIASMILNNHDNLAGSTLSGSMTYIVPEPATLMLLGLGGLLFRKRR